MQDFNDEESLKRHIKEEWNLKQKNHGKFINLMLFNVSYNFALLLWASNLMNKAVDDWESDAESGSVLTAIKANIGTLAKSLEDNHKHYYCQINSYRDFLPNFWLVPESVFSCTKIDGTHKEFLTAEDGSFSSGCENQCQNKGSDS